LLFDGVDEVEDEEEVFVAFLDELILCFADFLGSGVLLVVVVDDGDDDDDAAPNPNEPAGRGVPTLNIVQGKLVCKEKYFQLKFSLILISDSN
jgi:hypothetical protein